MQVADRQQQRLTFGEIQGTLHWLGRGGSGA